MRGGVAYQMIGIGWRYGVTVRYDGTSQLRDSRTFESDFLAIVPLMDSNTVVYEGDSGPAGSDGYRGRNGRDGDDERQSSVRGDSGQRGNGGIRSRNGRGGQIASR